MLLLHHILLLLCRGVFAGGAVLVQVVLHLLQSFGVYGGWKDPRAYLREYFLKDLAHHFLFSLHGHLFILLHDLNLLKRRNTLLLRSHSSGRSLSIRKVLFIFRSMFILLSLS